MSGLSSLVNRTIRRPAIAAAFLLGACSGGDSPGVVAPPPPPPPVDVAAPTVAITNPLSGASIPEGNYTVAVSASDASGVRLVQLSNNDRVVGVDSLAPYEFSVAFLPGAHRLVAQATDIPGNIGGSVAVPITARDTTPPSVSITDPQAGAILPEGLYTVRVNASDAYGVRFVQLSNNDRVVGVDSLAPYEFAVQLSAGIQNIVASATDSAGNVKTSAPTVLTARAVPTPTVILDPTSTKGVIAPHFYGVRVEGGASQFSWLDQFSVLPRRSDVAWQRDKLKEAGMRIITRDTYTHILFNADGTWEKRPYNFRNIEIEKDLVKNCATTSDCKVYYLFTGVPPFLADSTAGCTKDYYRCTAKDPAKAGKLLVDFYNEVTLNGFYKAGVEGFGLRNEFTDPVFFLPDLPESSFLQRVTKLADESRVIVGALRARDPQIKIFSPSVSNTQPPPWNGGIGSPGYQGLLAFLKEMKKMNIQLDGMAYHDYPQSWKRGWEGPNPYTAFLAADSTAEDICRLAVYTCTNRWATEINAGHEPNTMGFGADQQYIEAGVTGALTAMLQRNPNGAMFGFNWDVMQPRNRNSLDFSFVSEFEGKQTFAPFHAYVRFAGLYHPVGSTLLSATLDATKIDPKETAIVFSRRPDNQEFVTLTTFADESDLYLAMPKASFSELRNTTSGAVIRPLGGVVALPAMSKNTVQTYEIVK